MQKKGSQRYVVITSPVHAKHPPETMVDVGDEITWFGTQEQMFNDGMG